MNAILSYLIARLGEPSTYRGLFALLTALGLTLHPEQAAAITSVGLACIGLVNVFRKEHAIKLLIACLCLLTLSACTTQQRADAAARAKVIAIQIAEASGKAAAQVALQAAQDELTKLETAPLPEGAGVIGELARAAAITKARDLVAEASRKVAAYHYTPSGK